MSGGSWDYFCYRVEDVAGQLIESKCSLRRAFGKHMMLISKAMHDIEWADSGDIGEGDELDSIRSVFGDMAKEKELSVLVDDAKELVEKMQAMIGGEQ